MPHAHFMGLFYEAASKAGLHMQKDLAEHLGSSLRTVQRWSAARSQPSVSQVGQIAAAVFPIDPQLARRLAASVGLSIQEPPPPQPAPPPAVPEPDPITPLLVESVVAAAADVLAVPPRAMRPALLAAAERAKAAKLGLDDVLAALRQPPPAP